MTEAKVKELQKQVESLTKELTELRKEHAKLQAAYDKRTSDDSMIRDLQHMRDLQNNLSQLEFDQNNQPSAECSDPEEILDPDEVLLCAIRAEKAEEALTILKDFKSEFTNTNVFKEALAWAAMNGQKSVVKRMLDISPPGSVNTPRDRGAGTLLIGAAYYGRLEVVKLLVEEMGAEVDAQDGTGKTALSHAAYFGYLDVVQYLAGKGKANPDIKDSNGNTPLDIAEKNDEKDVVDFFRPPTNEGDPKVE